MAAPTASSDSLRESFQHQNPTAPKAASIKAVYDGC